MAGCSIMCALDLLGGDVVTNVGSMMKLNIELRVLNSNSQIQVTRSWTSESVK